MDIKTLMVLYKTVPRVINLNQRISNIFSKRYRMKKVFISLDTEGLSGLVSWNEMTTDPSCTGKAYIRELDWILDELFKLHPELEEVCICDSHARGENLPYGVYNDPRVYLIKGYPRQDYMLADLDSSYDMLMLVGYHGMIGTWNALMDHSYSSSAIYNARINGVEVGEVELNSYYAASLGVPLTFVAGDDKLEEELKATELRPAYVRTKEGLGRYSAKLYSPGKLEPVFRAAVKEACAMVENGTAKCVLAGKPTTLEIDVMTTVMADQLEMIPGVKRTAGRTLTYTNDDFTEIMHMVLCMAQLGGKFHNYR